MDFPLYKVKRGGKMCEYSQSYYMKLLEGRAKRLNELLEVAAPTDMICKEIMLLVAAAEPLDPKAFKSWNYGKWSQKGVQNENEKHQWCATG